VFRTLFLSIAVIALTDITLQLDNAVAISSVASRVPEGQRLAVVTGGVLLATVCLLVFTLLGATLVERINWLKPIAGLVLIGIGVKLVAEHFV
jgi:predicted tellurium resistance membrane protein TerC